MTAALLFAATFAAVFTLGIQQLNVERRHVLAAAATSPLIGLAHLALFKVLPGPTALVEITAYLAGGSAGIAAGIWAHPRLAALLGARRLQPATRPLTLGDVALTTPPWALDKPQPPPAPPAEHAERLGETLRLAQQIADEAARADIEGWCGFVRIGRVTWYDTDTTATLHGREEAEYVATAVRYLTLRERIAMHPTQPHLVRFEQ